MKTLTALAVMALTAHSAHAGAKITMDSLSADGLEMQKLSCDLDSGGFFGGIAVVGMVAKQKAALDACAPEGAAFSVDLDFRGGRTAASVSAGGTPAQRACIKRALSRVFATVGGRCSAVVLAGAAKKAVAPPATTAQALPAAPKPESESESEGTAKSAPARPRTSSPFTAVRPEQLRALVGKPLSSKPAQALFAPLAAQRTVSPFKDCTYHNYPALGLSMRLVGDTITSIFLYSQGADDFEAYAGALPGELVWTDTRRDIEAKLGAPTHSGGDGVIAFWAEYGPVGVTYRSKSPTSLDNALHHLVISAAK